MTIPQGIKRVICLFLAACFFLQNTLTCYGQALIPTLIPQALNFNPPTLKYLSVNSANPNNYFNFLLDKGSRAALANSGAALEQEARKLIHYFFIGLTLPESSLWVNLRPDEPGRITSLELAQTDMGKLLLEQDLRLKKDVAQYLNPKQPIGKRFWEELYIQAELLLGKGKLKKTAITTSNRVWIVPDEAVVMETEDGALVTQAKLKVLLESEYLSLKSKSWNKEVEVQIQNKDQLKNLTEQLMKTIIIPEISKEVNSGQSYAPLRQIYHSLILAQWFKRKNSRTHEPANPYSQAIDQSWLKGLESEFPWSKDAIWKEYLASFQKGEYQLKEKLAGLNRMYISGGIEFFNGQGSSPLRIIANNGNGASSPMADKKEDNVVPIITKKPRNSSTDSDVNWLPGITPVETLQGGQSNSLEQEKTAIKRFELMVGRYIGDVEGRLRSAEERLQRFREKNVPEVLINNDRQIIEQRKQNLSAALKLKSELEKVSGLREITDMLKRYSAEPAPLQAEVLEAAKRVIPRFKKDRVLFINEGSLLGDILGFRSGINGLAIRLAKNGDVHLGIIAVNASVSKAFELVSTLVHEDWHMKSGSGRMNELTRYIEEGMTTYLVKRAVKKIAAGRSQIANLIKEELSNLPAEDSLLLKIFRRTSYEDTLRWVIDSRSPYKYERSFVNALIGKIGEDFVMEIYQTGDFSLLRERLGEKKFDFISKLAEFSKYSYHYRGYSEAVASDTMKFVLGMKDELLTEGKLQVFKRLFGLYHDVLRDVIDELEVPRQEELDVDMAIHKGSQAVASVRFMMEYADKLLRKEATLTQIKKDLENIIREAVSGQLDRSLQVTNKQPAKPKPQTENLGSSPLSAGSPKDDRGNSASSPAVIGKGLEKIELRKWSKDNIIAEIKSLAEKGEPLNTAAMMENNQGLLSAARSFFGSWEAALKAAGIDYDKVRKRKQWSKDNIIAEIKLLAEKGEPLNASAVAENNQGLLSSARRFFGSLEATLKAAGIDYDKVRKRKQWSKDNIIAEIKLLAEKGEPLNASAMMENNQGLFSSARSFFGSWEAALKAAGIDYGSLRKRKQWAKDGVIAEIKLLAEKGEPLNAVAVVENNQGLLSAARSFFGSWEAALKAAGIDYDKVRKVKVRTKDGVIAEIKLLAEKGEPLNMVAVAENNQGLLSSARRFFGSWRDAVEAAGIDYEDAVIKNRGQVMSEDRLARLGLSEAMALLGPTPWLFMKYVQLYHPELMPEEVEQVARAAMRGLRPEWQDAEDPHLGYEMVLSPPSIPQENLMTDAPSIAIRGNVEPGVPYVQVSGAYTRRIVVQKDGTFSDVLPLPRIGEMNEFRLYALNPEAKQKSPAILFSVRNTGVKMSDEEAFMNLLALREELLEQIRNEPERYSFLLRTVEQSLLRHFTYDENNGLEYLKAKIKSEHSPALKAILQAILKKFEKIAAMEVSIKQGEKLYFFQKYVIFEVRSLIEEGAPAVILALEQGLGKTVVAQVILNGNGRPAVILTPNSVVSTWEQEAAKFMPKATVTTLRGPFGERDKLLLSLKSPRVLTNIEYVRKMPSKRAKALTPRDKGVIVIDEADFLGNIYTDQSEGIRRLAAGFYLLLTATPFKRIGQIPYLLDVFAKDPRFSSGRAFTQAFRAGSPEDLNALSMLLQRYTIRIRKQDVFDAYDPAVPLDQQSGRLPRKVEMPIEEGVFDLTEEQMQSILELFTDYQNWCRKHRGHESREDMSYYRYQEGYFPKQHALRQIMNDPAYISKPDLESPKHLAMDKIVDKELANNPERKIVIFVNYRAQVEEYVRRYAKYGARAYYGDLQSNADGDKTNEQGEVLYYAVEDSNGFKNYVLDRQGRPVLSDKEHGQTMQALDYERIVFQNDPSARIIVATYNSGSVGVTLTAADAVVFDDLAQTYRDEYQAADRAHRIDNVRKKYAVNYYWLQARYPESFLKKLDPEVRKKYFSMGTFDQVHFANIRRQEWVFHRIMDGVGNDEELVKGGTEFLRKKMPFMFDKNGESELADEVAQGQEEQSAGQSAASPLAEPDELASSPLSASSPAAELEDKVGRYIDILRESHLEYDVFVRTFDKLVMIIRQEEVDDSLISELSKLLLGHLSSPRSFFRLFATEALDKILGMIESPTKRVIVSELNIVAALVERSHEDTDKEIRAAAAKLLRKIGNPSAIRAALIELVQQDRPNANVRLAYAKALDEIADFSAIPALFERLQKDSVPQIRYAVSNTLHKVLQKNKEITEGTFRKYLEALLDSLLKESDYDVRFALAKVIDEIGDLSAIAVLLDHLKEADGKHVSILAKVLGNILYRNREVMDKDSFARSLEALLEALAHADGDRFGAIDLLEKIEAGLSHQQKKSLSLYVLPIFLRHGDAIHSLFNKLHQQGFYGDVVYGRAITAYAHRRGWVGWQSGSINMVSYGLLKEAKEEFKGLNLMSPTQIPIPLDTQIEIKKNQSPDDFGFIAAALKGKAGQDEEFLLYQPGYQSWKKSQQGGPSQEVYLLGMDPGGYKIYYLMPWGEVLSGCTRYGNFRSRRNVQNKQALSRPLWQRYQNHWNEIKHKFKPLYPEIIFIRDGNTIVNSNVTQELMQRAALSKEDALSVIASGIILGLDDISAFKLAVVQQYYTGVSGHALAINERIKQVRGILSQELDPDKLIREAQQILNHSQISILITQEVAQKLSLQHTKGLFEENIPAVDLFGLLSYLETIGLVQQAGKDILSLSEEPGISLKILQLLREEKLILKIKDSSSDNYVPYSIEDLKPFPYEASLRIELPVPSKINSAVDGKGDTAASPAEDRSDGVSSPAVNVITQEERERAVRQFSAMTREKFRSGAFLHGTNKLHPRLDFSSPDSFEDHPGGVGLYFTQDKKIAKIYADIKVMDREEGEPMVIAARFVRNNFLDISPDNKFPRHIAVEWAKESEKIYNDHIQKIISSREKLDRSDPKYKYKYDNCDKSIERSRNNINRIKEKINSGDYHISITAGLSGYLNLFLQRMGYDGMILTELGTYAFPKDNKRKPYKALVIYDENNIVTEGEVFGVKPEDNGDGPASSNAGLEKDVNKKPAVASPVEDRSDGVSSPVKDAKTFLTESVDNSLIEETIKGFLRSFEIESLKRGSGWRRLIATPYEAKEFNATYKSDSDGLYTIEFENNTYILPASIWDKMEAWSKKSPDFERKGYFIAKRSDEGNIEILDFVAVGSFAVDPALYSIVDPKTSQAPDSSFVTWPKEAIDVLGIDLEIQKELDAIGKKEDGLIVIPYHSHHMGTNYPESPSAQDHENLQNASAFVYSNINQMGFLYGKEEGSHKPVIKQEQYGGIDLSQIEVTLKDEKFVSHLSPVDLKVLRAAKYLKEGWSSLSLLYVHEIMLLLKDNLAGDLKQKNLLQEVLNQLQVKGFLDSQGILFFSLIQSPKTLPEIKLALIS